MKTFAIKNCPLCQKQLKLFYSGGQTTYYCSTHRGKFVYLESESTPYGNCLCSHYKVETNPVIQKTYIDNYYIESEAGRGVSRIYMLPDASTLTAPNVVIKTRNLGPTMHPPTNPFEDKGEFLMEVPMITPDHPDKLVNKIKLLLPFI